MLYGRTQTRVVPRVFTREELARIEAPTLLVLGERERIYPPDKAGRAARRLMPSVQVELIPRAHHVTAIANPEAVNACVTAFLGEHMTPVSSPRAPKPNGAPAARALGDQSAAAVPGSPGHSRTAPGRLWLVGFLVCKEGRP